MDRRDFFRRTGGGIAAGSLLPALGCVLPGIAEAEGADSDPAASASGGPWDEVRASFALDPEWMHLSGLYLASHPRPVREAVERHRRALDANPVHHLQEMGGTHSSQLRSVIGDYLDARPDEIAVTDSTTMGLGLVYNGFDLRAGQEILTTTHDHRATHQSLRYKADRAGVPIRQVALYDRPERASAGEMADRLREAITPRTRLVAVTWVHSSTGVKLRIADLAEVVAEANRGREPADRALLAVDGVHALGVETDTVRELGCDFLIAGTHKWMLAPRGTGIVWGHPRAQEAVTPTVPSFTGGFGWGGRMSPGGFKPFEHIWGMTAAFRMHHEIGKTRVRDRVYELNTRLKEGLREMGHVALHTPLDTALSSGITCFDVRGMSPRQVVNRLAEDRIIATVTPYADAYARFTPAIWNTEEEIDAAIRAVGEMG